MLVARTKRIHGVPMRTAGPLPHGGAGPACSNGINFQRVILSPITRAWILGLQNPQDLHAAALTPS